MSTMKAKSLVGFAALISFVLVFVAFGSVFFETELAKEITTFVFDSKAFSWLPFVAMSLTALWLRLRQIENRQGFARQFSTAGNARARDARTVEGEIEGSYFGYRIFAHEGQHSSTLFVETASPPVEFMIEQGAIGLIQQFRIFEIHQIDAPRLPGNHIFRTHDATGLRKLLNDDRFLDVLAKLKARPGFRFLLAANIPDSSVRLIRDGLGELAPFKGRSGLALMREGSEAMARDAGDVQLDVALLKELHG